MTADSSQGLKGLTRTCVVHRPIRCVPGLMSIYDMLPLRSHSVRLFAAVDALNCLRCGPR